MSDEAQDLQARLADRLAGRDGQGTRGIDMTRAPELMDDREVFRGPIFVIDQGESPVKAVLRELREETGLVPGPERTSGSESHLDPEDGWIDAAPAVYSSLGMSDELGHIVVLHLRRWHQGPTEFDPGEHIQSAWVSWQELCAAGVADAKAVVAIQHEAIRRLQKK